jgi:hypothetical protein
VSPALSLPDAIADELLAAELCRRRLGVRSAGDVVALTVTVVGVAGNLSSVAVAVPMFKEFARGLVSATVRQHPEPADAAIALRVTNPDGVTFEVVVAAADVDRATVAVVDALAAAHKFNA